MHSITLTRLLPLLLHWYVTYYVDQVAALLSRYLEYVGGKEDDGNAKIIQDSLQVSLLSNNIFISSYHSSSRIQFQLNHSFVLATDARQVATAHYNTPY